MMVHETAEQLNVSVEYVRKLLAVGKLQSLSLQDVAMYKQQQEKESKDALDELSKQAQELGMG